MAGLKLSPKQARLMKLDISLEEIKKDLKWQLSFEHTDWENFLEFTQAAIKIQKEIDKINSTKNHGRIKI